MGRCGCPTSIAIALVAGALAACQPSDRDEVEPEPAADTTGAAEPGVVEVTAVDYAFRMPAEIPSGWTTFHLANEGAEPHFVVLWKLPEGKTVQDYMEEVAPPFGMAYDSLQAGSVDPAGAGSILGRELPEWFGSVEAMGGPGILSPGREGRATVNLEPGTYVVECYIKTADQKFHSELGMVAQLDVSADATDVAAPGADMEMTLTNDSIGTVASVPAGEHTFAVHYEEHPDVGLGNDVHVARLDEGTSLDEVAAWMDWMNLEGFMDPAPVEFVGGVQEMPAGSTAYFTVTLEPGRYAWLSETTARQAREFTVE